jgi:DNA repair exonuclease SbcCD ATPase subunit
MFLNYYIILNYMSSNECGYECQARKLGPKFDYIQNQLKTLYTKKSEYFYRLHDGSLSRSANIKKAREIGRDLNKIRGLIKEANRELSQNNNRQVALKHRQQLQKQARQLQQLTTEIQQQMKEIEQKTGHAFTAEGQVDFIQDKIGYYKSQTIKYLVFLLVLIALSGGLIYKMRR